MDRTIVDTDHAGLPQRRAMTDRDQLVEPIPGFQH
jgi:hypothetical protein